MYSLVIVLPAAGPGTSAAVVGIGNCCARPFVSARALKSATPRIVFVFIVAFLSLVFMLASSTLNHPEPSPEARLELSSASVDELSPGEEYIASHSAGGMSPIGRSSRRGLNQSTHSSVANSTSSRFLH